MIRKGHSLLLFWSMLIPKATAYIDSRNLLHVVEDLGLDGLGYDYRKLAETMATSNGRYPKDLTIKMYGARFPAGVNAEKHHRDDAFYKHVETVLGIQVCYGTFKLNGGVPTEKGVDVRLATDLIMDAVYQKYDFAYIFSSDTDLIPAIQATAKMPVKVIVCLNPQMKHLNSEFENAGATPLLLSQKLLKSLAPLPVEPSEGSIKLLTEKFSKK